MASNSVANSLIITPGWEISPYGSLSGTESQPFDSPVQIGTGSRAGLEKGILLAPTPLSVTFPENVVRPQHLLVPLVIVGEQKTRRRRCLSKSKIVSVSYVSFYYFKSREDSVRYGLGMYEVGSLPEVEGTKAQDMSHILPFPGLLKNWKRESRVRDNGAQAKFYFHPTCKRMFGSLVKVVKFIRSSNNIPSIKDKNPEEVQGLSEASIFPKDNKRGNNGSQSQCSKSKKSRIFPVYFRAMKTSDLLIAEDFLADAYRNLMNLFPSTTEAATIEEEEKINVEAFLLNAKENLLKGFQKEETSIHPTPTAGHSYQNGGPEKIDEIKNDELFCKNISQHVQILEPSKSQRGRNPGPSNSQQGENAKNADIVRA